MKKTITLMTMLFLWAGFSFADDVLIKATGESGESTRTVKTMVDLNLGGDMDVIPVYVSQSEVLGLAIGTTYDFIMQSHSGNKGWLDFTGGGGGASELQQYLSYGYTGGYGSTSLESGNKTSVLTPSYNVRVAGSDLRVLVPVIVEDSTALGQNDPVTISGSDFLVFDITGVTTSGPDKKLEADFVRVADPSDITPKTIDKEHSIEVKS